jgi:hypothetical protein
LGKCIQSFGEETEMKEDHLEGVGVSGRTRVKKITKNNWGERVPDEFAPGHRHVASSAV